jgi:hypothetical protein
MCPASDFKELTPASQVATIVPVIGRGPTTARSLTETGLWDALARLEALQEEGEWSHADALADVLMEKWGTVPVVIVEIARMRARQGRRDEAIDMLFSEHVGKNVRLANIRHCVRLAMAG